MTKKTKGRAAEGRATFKTTFSPPSYRTSPRSAYRPQRLPNPADYYAQQGLRLTGSSTWKSAICPFHDDTQPSLRVNTESGAFCCMACGAKGGDVLAFHRLRYGLEFVAAAKLLGAWEGK